MDDYSKYGKYYSDGKFTTLAKTVGNKVPFIKDVVAMYYFLKDGKTPAHIKAMIVGALGYFILPLDLVPDIMPVAGWLDDAGVVAAVIGIIHTYITPEHRKAAGEFIDIEPI